jgi:hypothetical protein
VNYRDSRSMLWHKEMFNQIIPNTPMLFSDQGPYYGMSAREAGVDLICAKKAVIYGANVFGFPDMITAFEFRRRVYESEKLSLLSNGRPPFSVTLLDRKYRLPRSFANQAEVALLSVLCCVRFCSLSLRHAPDPGCCEGVWSGGEGCDLGAEHDVSRAGRNPRGHWVVDFHAWRRFNERNLPPSRCASVCHCQFNKYCAVASSLHRVHAGAAVIEIFPPHVKHVLYERIAHYVGVYHFKVYATQFPANFGAKNPTYFSKGCDKLATLDVQEAGSECWGILKNAAVVAPIDDLRVAVGNALDFIARAPVLNYTELAKLRR